MSTAVVTLPEAVVHNVHGSEISQRLQCVRGVMDHLPTSPFVREVILPLLRRRVENLNTARRVTTTTTKRVRR